MLEPQEWSACSIDNCERPSHSRGLCANHYQRVRSGSLEVDGVRSRPTCEFPDCPRGQRAKPWCESHALQFSKYGREGMKPLTSQNTVNEPFECRVPGCVNESRLALRICNRHNRVRVRFGLTADRIVELYTDEACRNAGCGVRVEDGARLHLDHDHTHCEIGCNDCVRGLLCSGCNSALGFLRDDAQRIEGLGEYLAASLRRSVDTHTSIA